MFREWTTFNFPWNGKVEEDNREGGGRSGDARHYADARTPHKAQSHIGVQLEKISEKNISELVK